MKISKKIFALTMMALSACAEFQPVPKSFDQQSSAIGISLEVRGPAKLNTIKMDMVYFIRLDEKDLPYNKKEVIQSNYSSSDSFYFLNAQPGRYAVVAASSYIERGGNTNGLPNSTSYRVFFPKNLINKSVVTVTPGSFNFIGAYTVGTSLGLGDADEAQLHYSNILQPEGAVSMGNNLFSSMLVGGMSVTYTANLKNFNLNKETEKAFLGITEKNLKAAGWTNLIAQRKLALDKE
ncbi:MAG: hypothetical protein ACHQYP_09070 [Nitrospiria bacterium]